MAGISQTKTYGVSYVIHGDTRKLTEALTVAKEQAKSLQTSLAQANVNLNSIFGGKADVPKAITELRDFYKEWATANKNGGTSTIGRAIEKNAKIAKDTEKKLKKLQDSPFTIKNGMIGQEAFTNIQKQIDQHVFNVKVKPVLSGDAKVALQEQLNTKEFTINVRANVTGVSQNSPKGTGALQGSKGVSQRSSYSLKGLRYVPEDFARMHPEILSENAYNKAFQKYWAAKQNFHPLQKKWSDLTDKAGDLRHELSQLEKQGVPKTDSKYQALHKKWLKAQESADKVINKKYEKAYYAYDKASANLENMPVTPMHRIAPYWAGAWDKNGRPIYNQKPGSVPVSSKKPYSSPTASATSNGMAQLKQGLTQLQNYIKANPLTGNFRVNYGESRTQVQRIIGNLRQYAMTKPIRVPVEVVWGNAGGQLQNILSGLQSFANGHGIKTTAKVSGTATGGSTGTGSTLTDEQKKESAIRSAARSKWSSMLDKQLGNYYPGWKEEQMAKYDKWAAKFPGTAGAERLQNFSENYRQRQLRQTSLDKANKQAERIEKQHQANKQRVTDSVMRDIEKSNRAEIKEKERLARESQKAQERIAREQAKAQERLIKEQERAAQRQAREQAKAQKIAQQRANAQRYVSGGPNGPVPPGGRGDIYTRMRKSWYPFTGNTSFGARTPMALDMAKGMGMMFAVSGVMQAVTSSFHQVAEYENMMKTVQAILKTNDGGANFNGRFKAMEEEVRRVGRETKFTAPEVAGAARFMAMAGLGIEDINAATNPIANLALVGDNDMSTTADKMTNIMTSFGLLKGLTGSQKKANMRHTSDVLTNTFTKSNTDLIQLAEAMQYAGPMSHLTGTSLEDAAAMVGVMGNAGIQSSMAGTTLRMMYQNIIKPNKKQAAEWKRLGINTKDDQGRNRDIFEILKDLRAKITGTTDLNSKVGADQLKIMGAEVMSLFRTTAGAGTAALLENLGEAINLAKSNRESNGVAQTIADEKKNTISGLWAQVTSTFTDQSVNTVNEFVETIKDMLRSLRDWLASKEAAETLRTIYDLAKSLLDVFGSVAKIWLKIYNFAPGIVKWFITVQMWATQIGFLVTPIIQVVGAITTLKNSLLGLVGSMTMASASAVRSGNAGGIANGAAMVGSFGTNYASTRYGSKYYSLTQRMNAADARAAKYEGIAARNALSAPTTMRNAGMGEAKFWAMAASNPAAVAAMSSRSGSSNVSMYANGMAERNRTQAERLKKEREKLFKNARKNRVVGNDVLMRRMSMSGGGYSKMGMWSAADIAFKSGRASGILSIAAIFTQIKTMAQSLFLNLAKGLGMLLSPVSLVTMAIGGLAFGIWKYYDNIKKAQEQTEALTDTVKRMNQSFNALTKSAYQYESEKGGFKPIEIGYQPTKNYSEQSLEGDKDAKRYLDAENMSGAAVYEDVAASGYYKYLTPSIISKFKSGRYDNEFARKAGLISVWQKRAIEDDAVRNAERAIIDAQTSGNYAKANEIVKAFADEVFLATKRMSELKEVQDVYGIKNPQDYKEWAMAQYQYIKEFKESVRPFESYKRAMYNIDYMNEHKDKDLLHDASFMKGLATAFMKSIPHLGKNGSSGQLIFDKTGHISWSAMAKKFNDGKDYNMAERYNIVKNIYDQMAQNEKMQKQPEILQMLRTYLPKLAGQNGLWVMPGDEVKYKDKFNPEDWREAVVAWHQLSGQYTGKKTADKFFKDKLWETVPNMNKISAWYREKYLSDAASKGDGKSGVTPPGTTDQSAYDSKYNNHQARPTQIIFNIDQLCKFEGTQVNSLDQKGIAESVGRQMAEGLQIMFAQAASDFAIIGDSNG